MQGDSGKSAVEISGTPFEWDADAGTLSCFGIPTAMFWLDPSMLRMLQPLVDEVHVSKPHVWSDAQLAPDAFPPAPPSPAPIARRPR